MIIGTQGYEKYIISEGILSVQRQSRVMFTHYAQDGLLNHIHRGRMNEEILVRTSRGMEDYTFRKIPTQGMLSDANLKMWNFPPIQLANIYIYIYIRSLRFHTPRRK